MMAKIVRKGEYAKKGDYHKLPSPEWKYYPVYLAKTEWVEKYLDKMSPEIPVLDMGCGEGVLVEKYKEIGYNIKGLDSNYKSDCVIKGNLLGTKFKKESFGLILLLDVIEHLQFSEQKKALAEINRILKPGGTLLMTIPNLAHFASRVSFLFRGKLIRTSEIERHPGDRPIAEYLGLIKKHGFKIEKRIGIFPTLPIISLLTYKYPKASVLLHKIENKIFPYANWCFLNVLVCKKAKK